MQILFYTEHIKTHYFLLIPAPLQAQDQSQLFGVLHQPPVALAGIRKHGLVWAIMETLISLVGKILCWPLV